MQGLLTLQEALSRCELNVELDGEVFVRPGKWDHIVELLTDRADASGRASCWGGGVATLQYCCVCI